MKFKKMMAVLALPVFAVSVLAAPEAKKQTKTAAPAVVKPAPQKTTAQILAFLPATVAEYKGKKITKQDVVKAVEQMLPPGSLNQIPAAQLKPMVQNVVKVLIERDILMDIMKKQGYVPSEKTTKAYLTEAVNKLPQAQKSAFEAQLKMQGKTLNADIAEKSKNVNFQQAVAFTKWQQEKVAVSDAEAKKFYEANKTKYFQMPPTVEAAHILIVPNVPKGKEKDPKAVAAADAAAKAKCEKILAQLKKGADFGQLAMKESACPSKSNQGKLGAFKKGDMVPAFEKAAFALKPGQLSGVVKTQFGYHIIKVSKQNPASVVAYNQVKDKIVSFLKEQKVAAMVEKEYKAAKVKINKF